MRVIEVSSGILFSAVGCRFSANRQFSAFGSGSRLTKNPRSSRFGCMPSTENRPARAQRGLPRTDRAGCREHFHYVNLLPTALKNV